MSKNIKLKNKCRTCFKDSKSLQLLTKIVVERKEESKTYAELLKDLTHIDLTYEIFHETPQSICSCCARKLKAAYAFVRQVREVNDKLWFMLSRVGNATTDNSIDCLQEAQIDIQNCLEIKIEDEEMPENSNKHFNKIGVELKLKGGINEERIGDVCTFMGKSETSLNKTMSECEADYNAQDIFDKDFLKPHQGCSHSDDHSISSDEADWAKSIESGKTRNNDIKSKAPVLSKKVQQNMEDNIPTPCDQCDRVFPCSRLLNRHKRHTHVPEELKVQCPYCLAKFGRRHNMYAHMRTHHKDKPIEEHITQLRKFPRRYACDQCDGTYTSKYYLLAHIKIKHNPDSALKKPVRIVLPKKRFLCTLCGSKFDTQSNLDVHIRRHTGEKPYNCDLCEQAFYRPCDVQAHRRSHTGEKPFKCAVCGKAFARSNKLKIHMRTHSNERPYKCGQCKKAFKHSKDLNIHKRIHTGERPYKCGVCQSTFTQSNSLKLHQTKQQHFEIIDQVVSCREAF